MTSLSQRRLLRALWTTVALILGLHLALQFLPLDHPAANILREKVHVDEERSVPTYLAALLLTTCGLLALWLARVQRLPWPGWGLLVVVFLGAALDEVASLHEELTVPVREALGLGGWLQFAWVVVGAALALVIVLLFLRTFLALPRRTRGGLALGAGLFLLGAIGMELPGGLIADTAGFESAAYTLVSTLEEALEFAGAIVWVGALSGHLMSIAAPATLTVVE